MGVSVVDNTEVRLCTPTGCGERIYFGAGDVLCNLHAVAATVADVVGANAIVIACGRLQPGKSHLNNIFIHAGYAIASAFHLFSVRKVGF